MEKQTETFAKNSSFRFALSYISLFKQLAAYWFGIIGVILILITCVLVLLSLWKHPKNTVINKLITADCLIKITNIYGILFSIGFFSSNRFCAARVTFTFFFNISDRAISILLAFCRWVYVNHSEWIMDKEKRKKFHLVLLHLLMFLLFTLFILK